MLATLVDNYSYALLVRQFKMLPARIHVSLFQSEDCDYCMEK